MPRRLPLTRSPAILRIKRRLEQDAFPRVQMSLIVGRASRSFHEAANAPAR